MPGGVNSPVRAFRTVGGEPLYIKYGKGSRFYDEDGNEFIDYVSSWGALILGHAHPAVTKAVQETVGSGTSFGTNTGLEITLAQMICRAVPSIEMVRFVNSGTEATMSAIRLARAATGRDKIVKFAGGYHGHSDGLLAEAGSGMATLGIPASPGVPASFAAEALVIPYNGLTEAERLFNDYGKEIAAVIVEPVAANMGVVPPQSGFLEGLRRLTWESGALLIFDEVITGFRVAYGGAQALYKVTPDLSCLGKIIGGGLPVGAYGGKRDIMEMVAPSGQVYQAGTLSGNPVVMRAGIETLKILAQPEVYAQLEMLSAQLASGIMAAGRDEGIDLQVARVGSILTAFFTAQPVVDYATACRADTGRYARFFRSMLSQGIYLPPSQFEACFVSAAHSMENVEATIEAVQAAFDSL